MGGAFILGGLDGVDLLDEFVLLDFLDELEEFVSGHVEVTDSGVETVFVHESIDVVEHVSTLLSCKKYFIEEFVDLIGDEDIALTEVGGEFEELGDHLVEVLVDGGDVVELDFHWEKALNYRLLIA